MEHSQSLKAFIFGASGAIGRDLVRELLKSPKWSQVTVVVRRKLDEWDTLNAEEKQKLQIQLQENLDGLTDPSKWDLKGYSSVFCCLGAGATEVYDEVYTAVNCTYPYNAGKLAAYFNVPHYSLVSGEGIHSTSWFSKLKRRGIMEDNLGELKFPHLSILKPALITDRRQNLRTFEKIGKYLPFIPQISAQRVAEGLRLDAELQHSVPHTKSTVIYHNSDIHKLVETKKYPDNI